MSQHLLDRCSSAEALVAARILEGADARDEAAELLRLALAERGENHPDARRARWLLALATVLGSAAPVRLGAELREALEGARDERPVEGTALDAALQRARNVLDAEEALDDARAATESGEFDRCEASLSLALADAGSCGLREEARRSERAAEILALRREETRVDSLLRDARERWAAAGEAARAHAVALRLGDRAWKRGELALATRTYDEARAIARAETHPLSEVSALRRLLGLAAQRRDPRATQRLGEELELRLAALPSEEQRERAVSHWVAFSVLRRAGDRARALLALKAALSEAEIARDMPLAWLAAAQLGEPLPTELVRRLQRPPIDAEQLCESASRAAVDGADPDLQLGLWEGAMRWNDAHQDADPALRARCERAIAELAFLAI
ncbi:MAG: hypothetical protein JNM84_21855 [Planctomycetes bacterium]|nr:hypothetical protein [Planctomycetota bacterium]